jgi:hypothetical protein
VTRIDEGAALEESCSLRVEKKSDDDDDSGLISDLSHVKFGI